MRVKVADCGFATGIEPVTKRFRSPALPDELSCV